VGNRRHNFQQNVNRRTALEAFCHSLYESTGRPSFVFTTQISFPIFNSGVFVTLPLFIIIYKLRYTSCLSLWYQFSFAISSFHVQARFLTLFPPTSFVTLLSFINQERGPSSPFRVFCSSWILVLPFDAVPSKLPPYLLQQRVCETYHEYVLHTLDGRFCLEPLSCLGN
jgi:hypothetical protein